jgi:asparagine synthase (glutamine-hydrolysing)
MRNYTKDAPTDDPLSLIQYIDMKTYLPGDILTKVDRASMAHALEVRVPLLDHELVEWISGLSSSIKLKNGEGKYIFKKSMERYLPHDILYRRKQGFAVPLASWFRGPLRQRVRDSLLGPNLAATGIFNTAFLREMVEQHESGRRDYSAPIWTVLMFEAFLRKEMEGASA